MTKKDYQYIAAALSKVWPLAARHSTAGETYGFGLAVDAIVEALQADNPRFDEDKFRSWVYTQ